MKVSVPMDTGNARIKDGSLPQVIQEILSEQQPEAAYFLEDDGLRTGYIVVNISEASEIPAIAEPWFLAFDARVELHPAMRLEDLAQAGPAIGRAVERFGR
jgi:hypothetical protein